MSGGEEACAIGWSEHVDNFPSQSKIFTARVVMAEKVDLIAKCIRTFPDFPTKGIPFKDICPILKDPKALAAVTDLFEEHVRRTYPQVDLIVGTLYAACELIKQQKAEVLGCLVVVELKYLSGSEKLQSTPVFSLIQY
ncbi:adenine phosphoribosyltransferase-like [Sinocyclocheilus rhinocerous]|uniref:adenine phosphoribosyltransferase-like n=1 Tax=Sinocyclocheilus rhinocerous TaxID=307959 RepID=UPI0007B8EDBE|nr:PREDICTED: adenine phosphoribosyltransferase-like [Sinocyclocheilus rhinocerous]